MLASLRPDPPSHYWSSTKVQKQLTTALFVELVHLETAEQVRTNWNAVASNNVQLQGCASSSRRAGSLATSSTVHGTVYRFLTTKPSRPNSNLPAVREREREDALCTRD